MACFRIFLCAGLAALTLVPANLAALSGTAGLPSAGLAASYDEKAADEPATSVMLLGGAALLMLAGRRRRY